MNALLFENPLLIGFVGVVFSLLIGFVWLQTGHRWILLTTLGQLALTAGLVVLNVNVVTDRERIEEVLHRVAGALGRNDLPSVFSCIHPTAAEAVMRAKTELPKYKFTEARVTGIKEIQVSRFTTPPAAVAEFNVFVALTYQGNDYDIRRFVRVYFLQREGRWLVHDYEHFEPTAGFREQKNHAAPQGPIDLWQKNR